MKKNILVCENKNRRTLRYYSDPYEESVFNSFNSINNKRVEDGCQKLQKLGFYYTNFFLLNITSL
jgi:hypothetical protein